MTVSGIVNVLLNAMLTVMLDLSLHSSFNGGNAICHDFLQELS